MRRKDYYKVLGIERTEDDCAIRAAFRRLAKKHHPDLRGSEETRHFQEILEAYSVLSDPVTRASYNENLRKSEDQAAARFRARQTAQTPGTARVPPQSESFASKHHRRVGSSLIEEMFDITFGGLAELGRSDQAFQGEGFLDVEVILSKLEAVRGGVLPLSCPILARCPFCGGSGNTGFFMCTSCTGRGMVESRQPVRIKIPAGIKDGSMLEAKIPNADGRELILRIHVRVTDAEF